MTLDAYTLAHGMATHLFATFAILAATLLLLSAALGMAVAALRTPVWRATTRAWSRCSSRSAPRFFAGSYLLLDLLAGFVLALLSFALFLELADETAASATLGRFDTLLAAQLQAHVGEDALRAFSWITHIADAATQTLICCVVALFLFARRQAGLAACWIAAVAGNGLLTRLLKAGFERTRPPHEHGWVIEDGWSFPSGHSSGAVAVYGMLAYLVMRAVKPLWRLPVLLTAISLILLAGYSRIVLQVHYFSDVLAGFAIAASWLLVCVLVAEMLRVRRRRLAQI